MSTSAALQSLLALSTQTCCRATLFSSRVRQGFFALFLALVPVVALAQVGREFVTVEAYVGRARVVHVGKILEIKQIAYGKPLEGNQKLGKPYKLVFEVSETIRGDEVKRLELVLALQSTIYLEYMRDHSVEVMLVGGPTRGDSYRGAEIGIEEQGKRVDDERYQFRLLNPVEVATKLGDEKEIAVQVNLRYDSCRMFTNELGIVVGREAILKRARTFAKQHPEMLSAVSLPVPNEFGALCADPNAFCTITLPICPETKTTLVALKNDPGHILRRIESRDGDANLALVLVGAHKALAAFPVGSANLPAGQPNEGALAKPSLVARMVVEEYERYFIVAFFLKNDSDQDLKVTYGRGGCGLEVVPSFWLRGSEDLYITPPTYLRRARRALQPDVLPIPAGKEILYGTFTMGYPQSSEESNEELTATIQFREPKLTLKTKPVRLNIPAQKSDRTEVAATVDSPRAPDLPGEWVDSDNGDLSLRLRVKSARIATKDSIFAIAEIRNNRQGPVTILRPFGWHQLIAHASQLKIWGEQGQIKYNGPIADYDLDKASFITLEAKEIATDTLELTVSDFAETGKAGNYAVRYDYSYWGEGKEKVADEGVKEIWHGTICSREVRLKKLDGVARAPRPSQETVLFRSDWKNGNRAKVTADLVALLKDGMTKDQVTSILERPSRLCDGIAQDGNSEKWTFTITLGRILILTFERDKLKTIDGG